ncbi:FAD binding domain-containing protein [Jiangella alkaliphila]|uniref:FAD binding domain-containing protein n=1 Tax=Jiangella alkaliphila TaxID=419479 RepID=A0A1H2H012_9ACTN|nr:FAD binding domain-containing protein [Jiangella alkaliphila]
MNTGIQDAINLGWKLGLVVTGRGDPALLDTYETEHAPVGRRVLRFTDRAFTIATSSNPLIRTARARVVPYIAPLATRFRQVRGYGFRVLAQLAIRYRQSPLSAGGASRRRPRPGDRLPDAPVTRGGRVTTLHTELGAPGFHLLLCGSSAQWPTSAGNDLATGHPGLLTIHRLGRHDGTTFCSITPELRAESSASAAQPLTCSSVPTATSGTAATPISAACRNIYVAG